jgi:hypothetical protein
MVTKDQVRKEGIELQETLEAEIQAADSIHIEEILRYVRWLNKQLPRLRNRKEYYTGWKFK